MRAEFTSETKRTLASRGAWRCSFPGCKKITIGPSQDDYKKSIILGQAAHIYAASGNGPRANPHLSSAELSHISNGIWLCSHHATLIDKDPGYYAAETLKQWKIIAEQETYELLYNHKREVETSFDTLIGITDYLLCRGIWVSADQNTCVFQVESFVDCDEQILKSKLLEFDKIPHWCKFLAIESQGEGVPLEKFNWKINENGKYEIICHVGPKGKGKSPYKFGRDLAWDFQGGDIVINDGDFHLVSGLDAALQHLAILLSSNIGTYADGSPIGSHFSYYCARYSQDINFLSRLTKIELIRLMTVQYGDHDMGAELDFINRIIKVEIRNLNLEERWAQIHLELELVDYEYIERDVYVQISDCRPTQI